MQERQEVVDLPLLRETAQVVRVAINRQVDGPVPIRHDGDTMIIPVLFQEVLVVEKRWICARSCTSESTAPNTTSPKP